MSESFVDRLPELSNPPLRVTANIQQTLNDRGKTHGDFYEQARVAQELKRLVKNSAVGMKAHQWEALDAICMKISRILHGNPNEPDHWRDIAGYATLVENILVHGKSHLE
jgi:hypothetical protein